MDFGRDRIASAFGAATGRIVSYFAPYYHSPSLQTHWKQYVRDVAIIGLVVVGLVAVFHVNSATYTFVQTSWSGGATATTANHGANRTGWAQYSAKDSTTAIVNSGADIQISPISGSSTQTSSTDFNAGTLSNVVVSGSGAGASLILTSSSAAAALEPMASIPSSISSYSSVVYPGTGDYIYASNGNTTTFYRYSISGNSWSTLAPFANFFQNGSSLTYDSSGNYIYVVDGWTSGFHRYSIAGNTWSAMASLPASINSGADSVYPGSGDYIYATHTGGSSDFWRYSISGNSWSPVASTSIALGSGSSMVYPGTGDYIYATFGSATTTFYRYSISGNSWSSLKAFPGNLNDGSSLSYPGSGDYIYLTRGGAGTDVYRYSISGNSWISMTSLPGFPNAGSGATSGTGSYLYMTLGGSANFYRYSVAAAVPGTGWLAMASTTADVAGGGALAYPGSGDYIYATPGNSATTFLRYSMSGNTWSSLASTPGAINTGTMMSDSGDYLYRLNGTPFYRYSISGNLWTSLTSFPASNQGEAAIYPGSGDYIYMTPGVANGKDFWRYSISGNSWTTLASSTQGQNSYGVSLVYPGSGDYIYYVPNASSAFLRYSISGNSWTTLASYPIGLGNGATLVYPGSGDYIYLTAGGSSATLARYSISGNSWSIMPSGVLNINTGGSAVYTGGSSVYILNGQAGTGALSRAFTNYTVKSFTTSGTFTSSVMDTGTLSTFTTLSYTASAPVNTTLSLDVRAGNTPTPDGTWTVWQTGIASGGNISALSGNRYVQYRANFTSSNVSLTPSLSDITFNYTQYTASTTLTSSAYDSSSSGNILGSIKWTGTVPSGTAIKFQMRTAPDASGTPGTWSAWMGPDGTANTYFTASDGSDAMPAAFKDGANDEWFQYKTFLTSTGANTPTLSDVTVTYVVNAPPEFDTTLGTQGSVAYQIATSTDPNWGKVEVDYRVRDPDTTTGSVTPGYITPSFEYNIGGGWVAIPSQNLSAGATSNKAVSQSTFTPYTAYVDVASLIPNTYTTTMQIRVKANDNEGANNITYAVTPTFTLDTKAPTVSSFHADGTSATNTVSFSATDNTTILNYVLSNNADLSADGLNTSSGNAQSVGSLSATIATPWNFVATSTKTVYLKLTDAYGNVASSSVTIPSAPSNIEYKDLSNLDTNFYREFVAWNLYPSPAPTGATFGSYKVYSSIDGTNFSLLSTITNPDTNYYIDTPVSTSTMYYYKMTYVTANGDQSAYSPTVSDTPDGKGGSINGAVPTISNVQITNLKNTSVEITWTTDDLALSEVDYGTTNTYGLVSTSKSYVTSHTIYLTGLTPNTTYYFRVRSIDVTSGAATNDNGGSGYTFTTTGGAVISSVTTPQIFDTGAEIMWNTNAASDSHVQYSTDPTFATFTDAGSDALVTSPFQHDVSLSGLSSDTIYYFRVSSKDQSGNVTVDDNAGAYYNFRTSHDTKPPVITGVQVPVKASDGAVITWQTDKLATSQVEYDTKPYATSSSYLYSTAEILTPTIFHSVTLSQETTRLGGDTNKLTKKTTYYYRVKSTDLAGNYAYSPEGTFTTTEDGAVNIIAGGSANDPNQGIKPTISNVQVSDITPFGATVTFDTNVSTRAMVQYGSSTDYTFTMGDSGAAQNHKVILRGLQMDTLYHFQASAIDAFGNVATDQDRTFTTTNLAEDLGNLSKLTDNLDSIQSKLENLIQSALPSINPPFIETPKVEDLGQDFARITWKTNVDSYGSVSYASEDDFAKTGQYTGEQANTTDKVSSHSLNLSNLKPNTKYHFQVKSYVFSGADGKSNDITFVTKAGDVDVQIKNRKTDSMEIVWNTTIPTTSIVTYKIQGSQFADRKEDGGMTTIHDIVLDNLKPHTTYEINAYGLTADGNTVQAKGTIVASTDQDITPPVITDFKVDSTLIPNRTDRTQTIVSWKTDEPATSVVSYDEGPGAADAKLSQSKDDGLSYTTNHTIILTTLKPATIYRFQIVSTDDAGNTTKLPVRTIVTPNQSASIMDVIFKNFDDTFKFMRTVH